MGMGGSIQVDKERQQDNDDSARQGLAPGNAQVSRPSRTAPNAGLAHVSPDRSVACARGVGHPFADGPASRLRPSQSSVRIIEEHLTGVRAVVAEPAIDGSVTPGIERICWLTPPKPTQAEARQVAGGP